MPSSGLRLVLLLLLLSQLGAAIQWLTAAAAAAAEKGGGAWGQQGPRPCAGLAGSLAQLCRRHREAMPCVARAAARTRFVCQETFARRRWNCSAPEALAAGTKESAFLYALAAAAVAHSIAQACAAGELPLCSCGAAPSEEPGPDFQWGGCGDNVHFGLQLGSAFADGPLKSSKAGVRAVRLMQLHNNAVGRQVLKDSMETKCLCHGVSGACSVKTCWKRLQDLSEIGLELKSKYLSATQVTYRHVGSRRQLVPKDAQSLKESELVYFIQSPNYCVKNPRLGSLGTQGRHCNRTSAGSDSCDLLCCGRGYNAYRESVEERCQCKYYWCCYVMCKKCQRTVQRYVCK
uniref:Protein Wnt n=1 Tax=Salvator merianae TaxID=96440 RepID=A0A8D0B9P8_SALMN